MIRLTYCFEMPSSEAISALLLSWKKILKGSLLLFGLFGLQIEYSDIYPTLYDQCGQMILGADGHLNLKVVLTGFLMPML